MVTNAAGKITRMNATAERLTGWAFAAAAGRPLAEVFRIVNARTRQLAPDPVQRVLADGEVVGLANHTALLAADGREYQIADSAAPIHSAGGQVVGVMLVFSDVSEQYQIRQALRQSEERFRTLAECSSDFVIRYDREGRHLYVNAAGLTGLQLEASQVFGKTHRESGLPESLCRFCEDHIARVFATGQLFRTEIEWQGPAGPMLLDWHLTPEFDGHGAVGTVLGVARDITSRRRPEWESQDTERRMQQTQRLQSLGVLTSGVAHDFNNILMAVLGHADLALSQISPTSRAVVDINEIKTAVHRASELCRHMTAYSGQASAALEPVDLCDLVEEMARLLKPTISNRAILRLQMAGGLPELHANPSQLRQVVLNLILNAAEAMGHQVGVIVVTTSLVHCDEAHLRSKALHDGLAPGPYLELSVRDTGCGMSATALARIFEPFYTTKSTGSGLGLAAVLGIIQTHQGALEVVTEPGRGTTFRALFPLLPGTAHSGALVMQQRQVGAVAMARCSWPLAPDPKGHWAVSEAAAGS